MEIKKKLTRIIKNQNKEGHVYDINLIQNDFSWRLVWKYLKRFALATIILITVGGFILTSNETSSGDISGWTMFLFFIVLITWIGGGAYFINKKLFKGRRSKFHRYKPYERELTSFIISNKLYEADNGAIYNHLFMSYMELPKHVIVFVYKRGDLFQKYVEQLGSPLESILGLYLDNIDDSNTQYTTYEFAKAKPEKIVLSNQFDLPSIDYGLKFNLYPGVTIDLRNNFSSLISGASGGGKSYMTYAFLTRFLSQTVIFEENGKQLTRHAKIAVIDPKMSDLYKLMQVSNMPVESYGYTVADAFRILKEFIVEMERRKAIYNESNAFNTVAIDLGLPPMLLVLEEYSSLVAMMDTKQKKEFESLLSQLVQQSRQLSMACLIIMQQPRSDSISTNVREQLANAFFMGNATKESAQMMFGTSDIPSVSGRGSGVYSIERSTPKPFEAPFFESEVISIILPVWKDVVQLYKEEEEALQQALCFETEPQF